ncbi:hypothetical protein AVEN_27527-1 [Araneus ventricosus]|uniref:Uncharacterized protein n=1 Tax=Araneus ventricosus TaxID=182803 RepID=A0A4Y2J8Y8_ARAVE|nr:hypothetical protein AVEN_27527-1 [Araneus ventricosus]
MRSGNYLQFQTILRRNTQEFSGFNTRPLSPGEYDIRLNVSWIFKMATADSFRSVSVERLDNAGESDDFTNGECIKLSRWLSRLWN